MNSVPTSRAASHSRTLSAVNSGPLSLRMWPVNPWSINNLAKQDTTSWLLSPRSSGHHLTPRTLPCSALSDPRTLLRSGLVTCRPPLVRERHT